MAVSTPSDKKTWKDKIVKYLKYMGFTVSQGCKLGNSSGEEVVEDNLSQTSKKYLLLAAGFKMRMGNSGFPSVGSVMDQ
ncbi:hypothetical protein QCA50_015627 [Cerrena zonata]|uniref:Uncharacterized protein n=1 Tax=Cerrena zonata TaxID=2478898 RepID=A0AAW0FIJ1_9APHY